MYLRRVEAAIDGDAPDHASNGEVDQSADQKLARDRMRNGLANIRAWQRPLVEQAAHLRGHAGERCLADAFAREIGRGVLLIARQVQPERNRHLVARDEDPGPGVRPGYVDERHTIDGRAIDRLARDARHARADRQVDAGRALGGEPAGLAHAGLNRFWRGRRGQTLAPQPPRAEVREAGRPDRRGRR